jgi:hypothetical protein
MISKESTVCKFDFAEAESNGFLGRKRGTEIGLLAVIDSEEAVSQFSKAFDFCTAFLPITVIVLQVDLVRFRVDGEKTAEIAVARRGRGAPIAGSRGATTDIGRGYVRTSGLVILAALAGEVLTEDEDEEG